MNEFPEMPISQICSTPGGILGVGREGEEEGINGDTKEAEELTEETKGVPLNLRELRRQW